MTPDIRANVIACAVARAHLYGAVPDCSESRRRYFRELGAINRLLGDTAAHYDRLS